MKEKQGIFNFIYGVEVFFFPFLFFFGFKLNALGRIFRGY